MHFIKIKKIKKTETEPVYHITVQKNHNFFANKLCVHNCNYRGEAKVILYNASSIDYRVSVGDRVAQMVIMEIPKVIMYRVDDFEDLEQTDRGNNGFGSTGV